MLITISEQAQAHFRKLLADQKPGTNIRVFVSNPGTSNAECGVSYSPEDDELAGDTIVECEGFVARIAENHLSYLEDAKIEFETNRLGGQLTLTAPNARVRKVADDAPLDDRVRYLLESEINPNLASHGGQVSLVELTDDNIAILQFGGGCHGCGMVNVTLKDGVEKTLLEKIPELSGVKDVTDHSTGENPYYAG